MIRSICSLFCAMVLSLLFVIGALAQATSRINGTVKDATGAVIAGAKVTATNEATGLSNTQTTTEAGLYSFPSLPVGNYAIKVEMTGFKTANKTGIVLEINTPVTADVALEVGQAN